MKHKNMLLNTMVKIAGYVSAVGVSIFFLLIFISFTWIRHDVKTQCENVKKEYGKDCVESLILTLKDEQKSYKDRNSAIWALGQLADKRALSVLKSYYTGNIPQREPLHKTISQYELKKAIRWCEEGNITSWMYKGM